MINVTQEDFSIQVEYEQLRHGDAGAVVIFSGLVREFYSTGTDDTFLLQHYPGMTESALQEIVQEAQARWPLYATRLIHRVGRLKAKDQIVFVGVSSRHRGDAFLACEFIIDALKTRAPFWKKEGDAWVTADAGDTTKFKTWLKDV